MQSDFLDIIRLSKVRFVTKGRYALRSTLMSALAARAERSARAQTRRFLRGLSADELQFIAAFLGSCILESAPVAEGLARFQRERQGCRSEDRELKMIVLQEYLCCSGMRQAAG